MAIIVDQNKFEEGHRCFEYYLYRRSPSYYRSKVYFAKDRFKHRVLLREEIDYKTQAHSEGKEALSTKNWSQWLKNEPVEIVNNVKQACKKSNNLLEHKYGEKKSSEQVLYKLNKKQLPGLAHQLYDFFKGKTDFGSRFDSLIDYFEQNNLNPSWAFLTYLAFLYDEYREKYFPIHPTWFNKLLKFYEVNTQIPIKKQKSWEHYKTALSLADALKEKLKERGFPTLDTVEIHSYMWIIARHHKEKIPDDFTPPTIYTEDADEKEEQELEQQISKEIASDPNKKREIIQDLKSISLKSPELVEYKGRTYKRDNKTIADLKNLYDFKCQICGERILKKDGGFYVEAAHIRPKSAKGPETPDNILILCPNHHKEFDFGDKKILEHTSQKIVFELNGRQHTINLSLDQIQV